MNKATKNGFQQLKQEKDMDIYENSAHQKENSHEELPIYVPDSDEEHFNADIMSNALSSTVQEPRTDQTHIQEMQVLRIARKS